MRVLVIHNPKSGSQSGDLFDYLKELLDLGCNEIVLRNIDADKDDAVLLRDAKNYDLIVLSGGDGTIATLNYELKYSNIPVQVFPSGTANLVASNLSNDEEPVAMAKAAMKGHSEIFDMGELSYHDSQGQEQSIGFSIIAGAGFDATIMQDSEDLKERLGQLAYFAAVLSNPNPEVSKFTLTLDGVETKTEGIAVLIINFSNITFDMSIVNDASPQDGLFHIAVLKSTSTVQLLPTVISALLDRSGNFPYRPQLEIYTAKEVEVDADPALHLQFDGEVVEGAQTPFKARVLEGASRFIVDANSPYYKAKEN